MKGLIFDFDGTLVDTMPLHWRSWQVVLERYQLAFTEEQFYSLGGVPARQILGQLAEEQGVALDVPQAAREKSEAYFAMAHEATLIEPVMAIAEAHYGQVPMAIATGSTMAAVSRIVERLGIANYFDAVVTSEHVTRQKPAPDIFLEAARRINARPQMCRAYEDAELGLQAASAAGMEAIDVRPLRQTYSAASGSDRRAKGLSAPAQT